MDIRRTPGLHRFTKAWKLLLLVRPKHVDHEGVVSGVVAANEEAGPEESGQEEREAGDERDEESKTSREEETEGEEGQLLPGFANEPPAKKYLNTRSLPNLKMKLVMTAAMQSPRARPVHMKLIWWLGTPT